MEDNVNLTSALETVSGVATLGELKVLYSHLSKAGVLKLAQRNCIKGTLVKVKAGLYALPGTDLAAISHKLNPKSYISTDTILAKHLLVGSVPARRIQAIKVGRPRIYTCSLGVIEHLSISSKLFFGYTFENGAHEATPEKAFLDSCYYLYKGRSFPFDLDTDVDKSSLDEKLIDDYLSHYDQRFKTFYNKLMT